MRWTSRALVKGTIHTMRSQLKCLCNLILMASFAAITCGQVNQPTANTLPKTEKIFGDLINPRAVAIQPETNHPFVIDAGSGRVIEWNWTKPRDVIAGFKPDSQFKPSTPGTIEAIAFVAKELLLIGTTAESGQPELRLYRWSGADGAKTIDREDWMVRCQPNEMETKHPKADETKPNQPQEANQTAADSASASSQTEPPVTKANESTVEDDSAKSDSVVSETEAKGAIDPELRGPCRGIFVSGPQIFLLVHDLAGKPVIVRCTLNGETLSKIERTKFSESIAKAIASGVTTENALTNGVCILLSPEQFYLVAASNPETRQTTLDFFDKSLKHKGAFAGELAALQQLAYGPKRGRLFAILDAFENNSTGGLVKIVGNPQSPDGFRAHSVMPLHHPRAFSFDSQSNLYVLQQSSDGETDNARFELTKITKLEIPPQANNSATVPTEQPSSPPGESIRTTIIE